MQNKSVINFYLFGSVLFLIGCAYFNTFYNAQQYFEEAEKARLEKGGEKLSAATKTAYANVIEKSTIILERYSDSKYVYPAMLLIGKSHYFREEYKLAEMTFRQLLQEGGSEYQQESAYWLALCKWKTGKPQPALDDLDILFNEATQDKFRSKIYLSIAEIYLDLDKTLEALTNLEKAATLTKNRTERGQIYYRLSELAFERKEYDRALHAYKNVIKNSLVKKRKEEANLQIVRIYRLKNDLKTAIKKIKGMLADEDFQTIYGELELELVKIFQQQDERELAIARLKTIVSDYPKTGVSAEAYFLLGNDALERDWNLEEAKQFFEQVSKETRSSDFADLARLRLKEINAYQAALEELIKLKEQLNPQNQVESDSTLTDTVDSDPGIITSLNKQAANNLFSLSELEAFHFNRPDSAISFLQELIREYPTTDIYSKALYTLSHLLIERGDTLEAVSIQDQILNEFPESEFSESIRKNRGVEANVGIFEQMLKQSEEVWINDKEAALKSYKAILLSDSTSEASAKAGYFLAYQYDRYFYELDSALKYYDWLRKYHPDSEQMSASRSRISFLHSLLEETEPDTAKREYLPDTTVKLIQPDTSFISLEPDLNLKKVHQDTIHRPTLKKPIRP